MLNTCQYILIPELFKSLIPDIIKNTHQKNVDSHQKDVDSSDNDKLSDLNQNQEEDYQTPRFFIL